IALMTRRFSSTQRERQHDRSTKMILTIMIIFIIVELPQGLIALVPYTAKLSRALGDLYEMITLLTSCIIFALLCTTSEKVRTALFDTRFIRFMRKAGRNCVCIRLCKRRSKLTTIVILKEDMMMDIATSESERSSQLDSVHL
ncbi:hypothetical protein PMAYCL1PPCAC_03940, partial [Pristionchus mayeri]